MAGALESMSFLSFLALYDNKFAGHVSETIFTKFCNLNILRLDYSNFSGDVNDIMDGLRCSWSMLQKVSLHGIMLGAAGISDTMPEWFVRKSSNVALLVPSNNQMRGVGPQ